MENCEDLMLEKAEEIE